MPEEAEAGTSSIAHGLLIEHGASNTAQGLLIQHRGF